MAMSSIIARGSATQVTEGTGERGEPRGKIHMGTAGNNMCARIAREPMTRAFRDRPNSIGV